MQNESVGLECGEAPVVADEAFCVEAVGRSLAEISTQVLVVIFALLFEILPLGFSLFDVDVV